jgi:acyl-CoA thioesterase-1
MLRRLIGLTEFAVIVGALSGHAAVAASVTVVALGTSNTYGKGVARNEAYPPKLQAALNARGIDARVVNAGINGDTAKGMLGRVGRWVPNGTRLVVIEIAAGNEQRGGVADQTSSNVAAIKSSLDARGIAYLDVSSTMASMFRGSPRVADGRHLAPIGYDNFVSQIAGQVASALGR